MSEGGEIYAMPWQADKVLRIQLTGLVRDKALQCLGFRALLQHGLQTPKGEISVFGKHVRQASRTVGRLRFGIMPIMLQNSAHGSTLLPKVYSAQALAVGVWSLAC